MAQHAALPHLPERKGLHLGWTEPHALDPSGRETGDPLGFRTAAARWAPQLVPVLTRSCCRVRQLSLFCLCLRVAHSSHRGSVSVQERFLRCERIWLLAHAREGSTDVSFAGVEAARRRIGAGDPYDIASPYLSRQLSAALWGQCRRPAAQLGLILGRRGGPEQWRLTDRGIALAAAAAGELVGDARLGSAVANPAINGDWLDRLIPPGPVPLDTDGAEVKEVGAALARHDAGHDGEFERLRRTFDHGGGGLKLKSSDRELTAAQARALHVLRALDRLSRDIERPYRQWLADGETDLDPAVSTRREWAVLDDAGERALTLLGQRLAQRPSMRTVQLHHERLAESRGNLPWTRRSVTAGTRIPRFEPIETRLAAAAGIFGDGVEPTVQP